jgi:hypothetical protein
VWRFCKVRPVEVKAAGGSLALCVQGYDLFFACRHRLKLDPCCPVLVVTRAVHRELPHTPSLRRQTRPRNPAVHPTSVVLAVACVRSLAHLEARSSLRADQELSGVKEPPEPNHGRSLLHVFLLCKPKKRADERTRTADLLITSARSLVAEHCTGVQKPQRKRGFCSLPCPLLQCIASGLGSN